VFGVLADSITPNTDYTQWTIKLRSGISFTDGTPLNADALIRNLNETGTGLLVKKALVDVARNADGSFFIDKVDDLTIVVHTGKNGDPKSPLSWPGFDLYLTGQWGLIASPKWLDEVKVDKTKAASPVGSGPFLVQSFTPHDQMVVTKNPKYWMKDANGTQLPYLDKITFKVIEDSATAEQALQGGNIDVFATINSQVIADFRATPDKFPMMERNKYTGTGYLLVDLAKKDKPIGDERVRCAISKAIDRKEIFDLVYSGIPTLANGVFSPGQEGHLDDNGFDPNQDLEAAKALIADYKKDHPGDITVRLGHTADRSNDQLSELIKGYLGKIGVNIQIDTVPQDQFINLALFGDKSFEMFAWAQHEGIKVDGQNFWWNSASGTQDGALSLNFARINDPQVDADLAVARSDPDPAKRQAAAEDINRTFAKHCYQIPIAWGPTGIPHIAKLKGLESDTSPDGTAVLPGNGNFSNTFAWKAP
jgi:peptide/nickel transport system substrate-binding protein